MGRFRPCRCFSLRLLCARNACELPLVSRDQRVRCGASRWSSASQTAMLVSAREEVAPYGGSAIGFVVSYCLLPP